MSISSNIENDDIDLDYPIIDENKFNFANLTFNTNVYGQLLKCNIKEEFENKTNNITDGNISFKLHPKCLINSMKIKTKTKNYKLKIVNKNDKDEGINSKQC